MLSGFVAAPRFVEAIRFVGSACFVGTAWLVGAAWLGGTTGVLLRTTLETLWAVFLRATLRQLAGVLGRRAAGTVHWRPGWCSCGWCAR